MLFPKMIATYLLCIVSAVLCPSVWKHVLQPKQQALFCKRKEDFFHICWDEVATWNQCLLQLLSISAIALYLRACLVAVSFVCNEVYGIRCCACTFVMRFSPRFEAAFQNEVSAESWATQFDLCFTESQNALIDFYLRFTTLEVEVPAPPLSVRVEEKLLDSSEYVVITWLPVALQQEGKCKWSLNVYEMVATKTYSSSKLSAWCMHCFF